MTTTSPITPSAARMPSVLVAPGTGERRLTPWGDGARAMVGPAQTSGAYTATELVAPPGWRRPWYVHHGVDECFYVAAGDFQADLDDGSGVLSLGPGAALYVPRGVARSLSNVGRTPGRLLLLQTPGRPAEADPSAGVEHVEAPEVGDQAT